MEAERKETTLYVYKPLSGDRVIRVAELQPGKGESRIVCELHETVLPPEESTGSATPKYQTLSYAWGSSRRDIPIICDGQILFVTKNLEAALRQLRLTDEVVRIWIDSICIDQDATAEKNHQVALMPLIYKCSVRVNVWLGEEIESTKKGIEILLLFQDLYYRVKKEVKGKTSGDWILGESISSTNAVKQILGNDTDIAQQSQEGWDAVNDIMTRSYFERAWIAQEILLAWNKTILIGSHYFPWKLLERAALISSKCECFPVGDSSFAYTRLLKIACYNRKRWKMKAFGTTEVLMNLGHSKCRDPRDIVYSLNGLAQYPYASVGSNKPEDTGLPAPDYFKPPEQVYLDYSSALITNDQTLEILSQIEIPHLRNFSGLPTWVFDWSGGGTPEPANGVNGVEEEFYLRHDILPPVPLAPSPPFPVLPDFPLTVDKTVLTAGGICIGEITWLSDRLNQIGLVARLAKLRKDVDERYGNSLFAKYINGEPILHTLCKVLLMGEDNTLTKARGIMKDNEDAWNPMVESFMVSLVVDQVIKQPDSLQGKPRDLLLDSAILKSGAGLFLSSVKEIENQRVFVTNNVDAMGIGSWDIKIGDRVVWLRGAFSPLILRCKDSPGEDATQKRWTIVCNAYVHAATNANDRMFQEELCGDWATYQIV